MSTRSIGLLVWNSKTELKKGNGVLASWAWKREVWFRTVENATFNCDRIRNIVYLIPIRDMCLFPKNTTQAFNLVKAGFRGLN